MRRTRTGPSVCRAWLREEHARYRADDGDRRDQLLLRWASLIRLRETLRGELPPAVWSATMNAIVIAISRGERIAPVYRRMVGR